MKAACISARETVGIVDKAVPEPRDDWVRVAVSAAGICGSDLHIFHHLRDALKGIQPGHETAGIVDALGDGVDLKLGTKVAIEPLAKSIPLQLDIAHKIEKSGSITNQIMVRLVNSDLVIADLTGLNSNVMYELGVRHAAGKPTVIIADRGTKLPFDIAPERTVYFERDVLGVESLGRELRARLSAG